MPTNRAAWQDKPGVNLSIRETPYETTLTPTQLLVKPHAWAINPCDHMLQDIALPFVKYPVILGEDIAGTVVAVGEKAALRFKPADRVFAFASGASGVSSMGGFQEYVIVEAGTASHMPEWLSFVQASVFPLAVLSSASALFGKDYLALPPPELGGAGSGKGKWLVVWGGSSALGSNAIQLARAAGFSVLATASPKNFELVKKLGAAAVFDYSSETVIADIVTELDRHPTACAGIFQAAGSVEPCLDISARAQADLFVATSNPIPEDKVPQGVRAKMVFGTQADSTVYAIYEKFLPEALARREYFVAPEPWVMETKGLEGIQEGYDVLKKGVSAKKIVVEAA